MATGTVYNPVKKTSWGTVILGGLAAAYGIAAFISTSTGGEIEIKEIEGFKAMTIYLQDLLVLVATLLALAGAIIACWNRLPGVVLLILAGVTMIIVAVLPASFDTPLTQGDKGGAGALGAPWLIAGGLILLIWWRSRKETRGTTGS
jgi:hypothetical protein